MACNKNKVRYKTYDNADVAAFAFNEGNIRMGLETRKKPYKCPECGGFHLTSMESYSDTQKKEESKVRKFIRQEAKYYKEKIRFKKRKPTKKLRKK
jgi:hypothetical protein